MFHDSPLVATPLRISKDAPHISELKAALRRRANIEPTTGDGAAPAPAPAAPTPAPAQALAPRRSASPPFPLLPTPDVENAPVVQQPVLKQKMRRRNVLGGGGGGLSAPLADRTNRQEAKKVAVAVRV